MTDSVRIRIPSALYARLETAAEERFMEVPSFIGLLLIEHLAVQKPKPITTAKTKPEPKPDPYALLGAPYDPHREDPRQLPPLVTDDPAELKRVVAGWDDDWED